MNLPNHFYEIQEAFEDDGHIYFHLSSHTMFLNVAKWVVEHIRSYVRHNDLHNHRTLLGHINDDV